MRCLYLIAFLCFSFSLLAAKNQNNTSFSVETFSCQEILDLQACNEFTGCSSDWQGDVCRGQISYLPIEFIRLLDSSFALDLHALLAAPQLFMLMRSGPELLKEIISMTQISPELLLRARCNPIFTPFIFNSIVDEAITEDIGKEKILLGNCMLFSRNSWKEFALLYNASIADLIASPWQLSFQDTEPNYINEMTRNTGIPIREMKPDRKQNINDDIPISSTDPVKVNREKIAHWAEICHLEHDKVVGIFLQTQKHRQAFEQEISNFCLFQAIDHGDLNLVEKAISLGANIHARDWAKKTPINRAMEGSFIEIVDYLKSQGALLVDQVAEVMNNKEFICLKRSPEKKAEGYCLIKDYDFEYPPPVAQLIIEQTQFWEKTGLGKIQIPDQIKGFSIANDVMSSYVGNFELFNLLFKSKYMGNFPLWRGQSHFSGKDLTLSRQADAINFEILGAPKSPEKIVVYRGIKQCSPNMFLRPGRILSTSANPLFSLEDYHEFRKDSCFLEIHLPQGFPAFFVDISFLRGGFPQQEFLLPMFYLNTDFELVEAEYELISESQKDHVSSYPKLDGSIEYRLGQVYTYVLTPKNPLTYSPEQFGSFDEFQALYVKKLCDSKNLGSMNELERICSSMTSFWSAKKPL